MSIEFNNRENVLALEEPILLSWWHPKSYMYLVEEMETKLWMKHSFSIQVTFLSIYLSIHLSIHLFHLSAFRPFIISRPSTYHVPHKYISVILISYVYPLYTLEKLTWEPLKVTGELPRYNTYYLLYL